jgi:hypothetical protein
MQITIGNSDTEIDNCFPVMKQLRPHLKSTGKGYAGALLDWIFAKAKELHCDQVHLDSGYQRHDAHRLYLKKGMKLACHHFSKDVL